MLPFQTMQTTKTTVLPTTSAAVECQSSETSGAYVREGNDEKEGGMALAYIDWRCNGMGIILKEILLKRKGNGSCLYGLAL